jgi:mxaJ protein
VSADWGRPLDRFSVESARRAWRWHRKIIFLLVTTALSALGFSSTEGRPWELRVCTGTSNLPYSNRAGEGFENRIAEILAEELGAELVNVWLEQMSARTTQMLIQQGDCDAVMGVTDGNPHLMATLAYYRSSYMFAYRRDAGFQVGSLDDPILREVTIGVHVGGNGVSPAGYALAKRDLIENQVTFMVNSARQDPLAEIVEEVARGSIDVGIVWGPVAGYFAERQGVELELVPVSPRIELPFVPMVHSISIGVRFGDEALRDRLNLALTRRWDDIQGILNAYRVPLEPLPVPSAGGP